MRKFFRKLRSKRGESFVEILIAILIVAFGCMIIATMYTSSMNINISASEADDAFYAAMSDTEQMIGGDSSGSGNAVLSDEAGNSLSVEVDTYGDDAASAYKKK